MHSLGEGYLGCFQFLPITNNFAMNIVEQMYLMEGGTSYGYMPRNDIAGAWGRSIPNLQWDCIIGFWSGCKGLHY